MRSWADARCRLLLLQALSERIQSEKAWVGYGAQASVVRLAKIYKAATLVVAPLARRRWIHDTCSHVSTAVIAIVLHLVLF